MLDTLRDRLLDIINESSASRVALAARQLGGGDEILINADVPFHPASVIKICLMMEVFRQVHGGLISMEDPIPVVNRFPSLIDGGEYSLEAADDSDKDLYACIGQSRSRRELVHRMISRSSNLATNILLAQVLPEQVTAFMRELGASDLVLKRGMEDKAAYRAGLNNSGSARGFMRILTRLAARQVISPEASDEMLGILLKQEFNEMIPALLPPNARIAHKTGWAADYHHDAGIIYPPRGEPIVLCILTKGFDEAHEQDAHRLVSSLARCVYDGWVTASA